MGLNCNSLITKALEIAVKAHQDDTRKGKQDVPYIVHPMEVAMTLQKEGKTDELIAAGLLHDTLEDTEYEEEDLRELFNDQITELVLGASEELEDRENTPWEERKQHTIDYLKTADMDVKYIACADKLSNIRSMIRDYKRIGDKLWGRFNRGYEKQKWYYESLIESLDDLTGVEMYEEFKAGVEWLF